MFELFSLLFCVDDRLCRVVQGKNPNFSGYGIFRVAICPRDTRPNRSTPDLSRSLESDAAVRVCRPRRCLLCARRYSAGSARFDTKTVLRPQARCARALCPEKGKRRECGSEKLCYRATVLLRMIFSLQKVPSLCYLNPKPLTQHTPKINKNVGFVRMSAQLSCLDF